MPILNHPNRLDMYQNIFGEHVSLAELVRNMEHYMNLGTEGVLNSVLAPLDVSYPWSERHLVLRLMEEFPEFRLPPEALVEVWKYNAEAIARPTYLFDTVHRHRPLIHHLRRPDEAGVLREALRNQEVLVLASTRDLYVPYRYLQTNFEEFRTQPFHHLEPVEGGNHFAVTEYPFELGDFVAEYFTRFKDRPAVACAQKLVRETR